MLRESQINRYLSEDCVIERARILKEIKDKHRLSYDCLSLKLYESVRNLKRLYKLNNLISEFASLLQEGTIRKVMAYELSSLDYSRQREIYQLFKHRLDKWAIREAISQAGYNQVENEVDMKESIYFDNRKLMDQLALEVNQENVLVYKKCN